MKIHIIQRWLCLCIQNNYSLSSLTGLEGLSSIDGSLLIVGNFALTSLKGLDNVDGNTVSDLYIYGNPYLSSCDIQSICDYLAIPNGTVKIHDNATGCKSQEEVEAECIEGVDESVVSSQQSAINIYPNPSSNSITIELPTQPSKNTTLILSNTNGQRLITQTITESKTEIDITHLPTGIYIVKVWNDKEVMVQKVVKEWW